jgi:hypothetical protein
MSMMVSPRVYVTRWQTSDIRPSRARSEQCLPQLRVHRSLSRAERHSATSC